MLSAIKKKMRTLSVLSPFYRRRDYQKAQQVRGSATAHVKTVANGVEIEAGPASFAMRVIDGEWADPGFADYAAFGLAAASVSNGLEITLETPVSVGAAKSIHSVSNAFRLWAIDRLSPVRVNVPNTLESVAQSNRARRVICLSGGIDSTFAAVQAFENGNLDSFLLIAGADYPHSNHHGFIELRDRVSVIAERFNKPLTIVETSIRQTGINWELTHGFNLAACLHFLSGSFSAGGFALDNAIFQDFVRVPWGNNSALPNLFSTMQFPIEGYGAFETRVSKLWKIHAFDPNLVEQISVCWRDKTKGGNCGKCRKCIETRIAFRALGISDKKTFQEHPALEDEVVKFHVSPKHSQLRGQLVRVGELVDALEDGDLRSLLVQHESRLRDAFFLKPMRS